eukprot:1143456-Pelagomonas_calceolata.AAC.7
MHAREKRRTCQLNADKLSTMIPQAPRRAQQSARCLQSCKQQHTAFAGAGATQKARPPGHSKSSDKGGAASIKGLKNENQHEVPDNENAAI